VIATRHDKYMSATQNLMENSLVGKVNFSLRQRKLLWYSFQHSFNFSTDLSHNLLFRVSHRVVPHWCVAVFA